MSDGERDPDPAFRRRQLAKALRRARAAAGLTQAEASRAMDWSESKLLRFEAATVTISTNDLRALLALYTVDPAGVALLVELVRAARKPSPWAAFKDVAPPECLAFLANESSAVIVRSFDPLLVPDLLQTEEYARAVIEVQEAESPDRVDSLVDLRVQRQEVLVRQPETELHFILDEAVIHRVVGDRTTTVRQLHQILEIAEYPNVTIRVVPFSAGMYARLRAPYVLFEFADNGDEDVLYLEGPLGNYVMRESGPGDRDRSSAAGPEAFLEEFWRMERRADRADLTRMARAVLSELT